MLHKCIGEYTEAGVDVTIVGYDTNLVNRTTIGFDAQVLCRGDRLRSRLRAPS